MIRKHSDNGFSSLLLAATAVFVFALGSSDNRAQSPSINAQKRAVVIIPARPDSPSVGKMEPVFKKVFIEGMGGDIDVLFEYVDVMRFPEPEYEAALYQFLLNKYHGQHVDLVVSAYTSASNRFVTKYRSELFPGAAAIYVLESDVKPDANSTGVWFKRDFTGTVDLALKLLPDTERIYVLGGRSELDRSYQNRIRPQLEPYRNRLDIIYLTELSMPEITDQVSKLPPRSILYLLAVSEDRDGNRFVPAEVFERIAPLANVPTFSFNANFFKPGVVGGDLEHVEILANYTAEVALRVLRGEKADDILVREVDPSVAEIDWREVQRWGIPEDRVPVGTIVHFKEPTFWEQYKWRIVGVIGVLLLQTVLILVLLLNREQRMKAEEEREQFAALAAHQHRQLGEVVSNVPGIVWESRLDPDTKTLIPSFVSRHVEKLLGYSVDDWMSTQQFWLSIIPEQDKKAARDQRDAIFAEGESGVLQFPWRKKDGAIVWVEAHLSVMKDEDGKPIGLRGVTLDINDRKLAEASLHTALAEISELKDRLQMENLYLRDEIKLEHHFDEIIGNSDEIKYVLYKTQQVAETDATVLIQGETGTGKELVARAIHGASDRKDRPLVKVNCAALPSELIESELFGHEKGAFTGAQAQRIGRFELADRGTLFLDEIGEMPIELQPKLLRVLQDGEFERLGSTKTLKVDVRVIAATNRELEQEIQKKLFREDLWYRLNVFPITVPPLRHRRTDIPLIANYFIKQFSKKHARLISSVDPRALEALQNYDWPGNVRELSNVIERAIINSRSTRLGLVDDLSGKKNGRVPLDSKTLEDLERGIILERLETTHWKISGPNGAAASLGLHPNTLRTRMTKLDIHRETKSPKSTL